MANARFKDEDVFIDGIDLRRIARHYFKLRGSGQQPPQDLGQAMDDCSRILGFESHHALRSSARRHPAESGVSLFSQLQREAKIHARKFPSPRKLGARFGFDWQKRAEALFRQALEERDPLRVEIIALVGAAGSGKTMLAQHMVELLGGTIQDATLCSSSVDVKRLPHGALVVHDRPAKLPVRIIDEPAALFWQQPDRLDLLTERTRRNFNPYEMPGGLYLEVLDHAQHHKHIPVIVVQPSTEGVHEMLTSILHPGVGENPGHFGFQAARVVNLDTMTTETIVPPSLASWAEKRRQEKERAL